MEAVFQMAKATINIERSKPDPVAEQAQAIQELTKALADNHEGVIMMMEIAKELKEMGALELVLGLLKARKKVGYVAIQQMNQPGMHHMVKNLITLVQFMGTVQPSQLQGILHSVSKGIERSAEDAERGKTTGLWQMGKSLRDPEVNAAITMMLGFLRGMGEGLHHPPVH